MGFEFTPVLSVAHEAKFFFYLLLLPLIFYSFRFYIFGLLSPFMQRRKWGEVSEKDLPFVTIQIPVYNDPMVGNCVKDCLNFDYPKDKFEVIVADDSNDPETLKVIQGLRKFERVKVLHRDNRNGFKAGALNNALKHSKGEVILIFDADYRLERDFLKRVIQPFHYDENIAFVQSRWGYSNPSENAVTRIASMSYRSFHNCCLPVQVRMGSAIFCGSGGAVRRRVLEEVGGWNEDSITEDLDLSIKVLKEGYRQEYLSDLVATGDVPHTLKGFVKQQQRWAYGTTVALIEYLDEIMLSGKLNVLQKVDFVFLLSCFIMFPFVLGMVSSSMIASSPWFGYKAFFIATTPAEFYSEFVIGVHKVLAGLFDFETLMVLGLSSGFLFATVVAALADRRYSDLLYLPFVFLFGLFVQVYGTISVFQAVAGVKVGFYKTPKKSI